MNASKPRTLSADVCLVGAGIMSATVGALLRKVWPECSIVVLERAGAPATESSAAWNNAGTGHSAFCELNYTPEDAAGEIDISKAEHVAEQFEQSRQFWASLVEAGDLARPESFIRATPHASFVMGAREIQFLRHRHAAMTRSPLFEGMEFETSPTTLAAWFPLVLEGRDAAQPVAATRMRAGTDVNFGALCELLLEISERDADSSVLFGQEVHELEHLGTGRWRVLARDREHRARLQVEAGFVFIGAGGAALPLLEKSGVPEAEGYGGFPVSGQWLRCTNPQVIQRHDAKVYGRLEAGSPPMSMPHLDTRHIDGRRELLFGPYAGFSTKFLKRGSPLDLLRSLDVHNVMPMLEAGVENLDLVRYLLGQVVQSQEERLESLLEYYPLAQRADWKLVVAGQRVQIIKDEPGRGGTLEFGTELVSSADGTLAALLGASPGASTAVSIALELLERCFADRSATAAVGAALERLIPSRGRRLADDPELCRRVRARSARVLGLR